MAGKEYRASAVLAGEINNALAPLLNSGIMEAETAVEKINDVTKRQIKEAVTKKLGFEPKIYTRGDGRVFAKIKSDGKWKQVSGADENALYRNLYDTIYSDYNITLAQLFPRFMLYRRNMHKVTGKTLVENRNDWNKFLKDSELVNIPMRNLKAKNYIRFFEEITKDGNLTRKCVSNVKSLLNKMYYYAIQEELVTHNPVKDIDFSEFNSFVPDQSGKVYTMAERKKLLEYLHDIREPYALAIQLDFQLTCRIGEIKGLRWENVNFESRTITINMQALRQRQMNDDLTLSPAYTEVVPRIKGNTERGKRTLPMTREAERILTAAKEINPDGEYVFMPRGQIMLTDTFNEYLKKYCSGAGVPYLSSHKIRFTTCSMLYQTTNDLSEVSRVMGHSQTATTLHYLRNVTNHSDVLEHMENAFAPNRTK